MASGLFDKAREAFLGADLDWNGATAIKVYLVDHGTDTPNLTTDDFLDDIAAGARIGTAQAIANRTITNGIADGDDVTFPSVTGASAESVLIFLDTGTESTSRLIASIDSGTGLPVTPNGGDITVQWSAASPNIFKL